MPDVLLWDLDYTPFSTISPSQPHRKRLELFMQSSIINVSTVSAILSLPTVISVS